MKRRWSHRRVPEATAPRVVFAIVLVGILCAAVVLAAHQTWVSARVETLIEDENRSQWSTILINANMSTTYKLTSLSAGVMFDTNGDGTRETVAWTEPNSKVAFLALDRNGDGKITSGKELVGNHTVPGASNGYEALRRLALETNGGIERGSISSEDPIFEQLLLWTDVNHNGVSEPDELRAASEVVSDIGLGWWPSTSRDEHGNQFRRRGWVHIRTAPGRNRAESKAEDMERTRYIWDVWFLMG